MMEIKIFKHEGVDVVSSRIVANELGKRHDHILRDINKKIDTTPSLGALNYFIKNDYLDTKNELRKEYLLTQDGFTFLVFSYNGYDEFKMAYIEEFNRMKNILSNIYNGGLGAIESAKELVQMENKKLQIDVEQKQDIITGLVDNITLSDKRQVLNRVVRMGGVNFQYRWKELYKQFELKEHINLEQRFLRYNDNNKPKLKNKLEYIDKVLNKIPELYEIACKLYSNDVNKLVNDLYNICVEEQLISV